MKKIMSLMLGMSLVLGTASMFAQDKPADAAPKTAKKHRKSKKVKKTDATTATPSTETKK